MPKPLPRIKLPAQARERVYRAAAQFARSCADTMISNLENQLSAELHAAMRQPGAISSVLPNSLIKRGQAVIQQPGKVAHLTGSQVAHEGVAVEHFEVPIDHAGERL